MCKGMGCRFLSRPSHSLRGLCRRLFASALDRPYSRWRCIHREFRRDRVRRYREDCIHMLEVYQEYAVPTLIHLARRCTLSRIRHGICARDSLSAVKNPGDEIWQLQWGCTNRSTTTDNHSRSMLNSHNCLDRGVILIFKGGTQYILRPPPCGISTNAGLPQIPGQRFPIANCRDAEFAASILYPLATPESLHYN